LLLTNITDRHWPTVYVHTETERQTPVNTISLMSFLTVVITVYTTVTDLRSVSKRRILPTHGAPNRLVTFPQTYIKIIYISNICFLKTSSVCDVVDFIKKKIEIAGSVQTSVETDQSPRTLHLAVSCRHSRYMSVIAS